MSQAPIQQTAIHDIGYRHYDGPRLGQGYLTRALIVDGVRAAYGVGRAGKSKVMPFVLFGLMMLTALIAAVIAATAQTPPGIGYAEFGMGMQILVIIYAAGQAPTLVSRDLRHGVMPLYFSRPLRRVRYVVAKLVAMTIAIFLFVALGVLVLYVGALLAKQPFWENTGDMLLGLVATFLQAVTVALISLTIAAYLPQRGLGVTIIVAVYLVTIVVSGVIGEISRESGHEAGLGWALFASPFLLVEVVSHWILRTDPTFERYPPGWVGGAAATAVWALVLLGCWLALQGRYRKAVNR